MPFVLLLDDAAIAGYIITKRGIRAIAAADEPPAARIEQMLAHKRCRFDGSLHVAGAFLLRLRSSSGVIDVVFHESRSSFGESRYHQTWGKKKKMKE